MRRTGSGEHRPPGERTDLPPVRQFGANPGITLFRAQDPRAQAGVLSLQVEGMGQRGAGRRLGRRGVAVRAGLHCAPLAHKTAGTLEEGTVRLSVSAFNQPWEMDAAARQLRQVCSRAGV